MLGLDRKQLKTWFLSTNLKLEKYHNLVMRSSSGEKNQERLKRACRRLRWEWFFHDFANDCNGLCVKWSRPEQHILGKVSIDALVIREFAGICDKVMMSMQTNVATFHFDHVAIWALHGGNGWSSHNKQHIVLDFDMSSYDFLLCSKQEYREISGVSCRVEEDGFIIHTDGLRYGIFK